jgi:hydrogenase nickel incorporation protein HypA/HybF
VHELSIGLSLIELVEEQLMLRPDGGAVQVTKITVNAGKLCGVVPAALRSAFTAAIEGTPLARARLEIVETSAGSELDLISMELTETQDP